MPTAFLSQAATITTGFLNTVNDAQPGQLVASPTGNKSYTGLVGARVALGSVDAAARSKTNTLFGGIYQYVQFKAGMTAVPARGQLAFWNDYENFIVTMDEPTNAAMIAGIVLNAVTAGNFGWIQITGKANVLFRAAVTKGAPAIGDGVIAAAAGAGASVATADVLADATGITSLTLSRFIGTAIAAPASGAISLVQLKAGGFTI